MLHLPQCRALSIELARALPITVAPPWGQALRSVTAKAYVGAAIKRRLETCPAWWGWTVYLCAAIAERFRLK